MTTTLNYTYLQLNKINNYTNVYVNDKGIIGKLIGVASLSNFSETNNTGTVNINLIYPENTYILNGNYSYITGVPNQTYTINYPDKLNLTVNGTKYTIITLSTYIDSSTGLTNESVSFNPISN